MREIKFRGKTILTNEWVYGYFTKLGNSYLIADGKGGFNEVYPSSVGQFTGLKDKKGTDVYEGDIILPDWDYDDGELPISYREEFDGYGEPAYKGRPWGTGIWWGWYLGNGELTDYICKTYELDGYEDGLVVVDGEITGNIFDRNN